MTPDVYPAAPQTSEAHSGNALANAPRAEGSDALAAWDQMMRHAPTQRVGRFTVYLIDSEFAEEFRSLLLANIGAQQ